MIAIFVARIINVAWVTYDTKSIQITISNESIRTQDFLCLWNSMVTPFVIFLVVVVVVFD